MKVLTVVGARPQFIKAAVVSRALAKLPGQPVKEVLVHTGQHHDANMSQVFFDELDIPPPKHHLAIAGGRHGEMTGRMLQALESTLLTEQPDMVLVYGDTNSTLAGALASAKLHIPLAHVEAGLRSFNMRMPEEVNRVVADRVSNLLFCPTQAAVANLAAEGRFEGVHLVGDVMFDAALYFGARSKQVSSMVCDLGLEPGTYVLATCHRAENTDDPKLLKEIFVALGTLADDHPVVFPLHPRTRKRAIEAGILSHLGAVRTLDPVGYIDMIALERSARTIITDSGGVQKEAYFFQVPCVTLRQETEWVETVTSGWNCLVPIQAVDIHDAVCSARRPANQQTANFVPPYGDGKAGQSIAQFLQRLCAGVACPDNLGTTRANFGAAIKEEY